MATTYSIQLSPRLLSAHNTSLGTSHFGCQGGADWTGAQATGGVRCSPLPGLATHCWLRTQGPITSMISSHQNPIGYPDIGAATAWHNSCLILVNSTDCFPDAVDPMKDQSVRYVNAQLNGAQWPKG